MVSKMTLAAAAGAMLALCAPAWAQAPTAAVRPGAPGGLSVEGPPLPAPGSREAAMQALYRDIEAEWQRVGSGWRWLQPEFVREHHQGRTGLFVAMCNGAAEPLLPEAPAILAEMREERLDPRRLTEGERRAMLPWLASVTLQGWWCGTEISIGPLGHQAHQDVPCAPLRQIIPLMTDYVRRHPEHRRRSDYGEVIREALRDSPECRAQATTGATGGSG